ncbi:glycerate kinase-like isoform X2 [Watersipora subatra]|uniref:glycerate kinase-like isoform X2 n=1 Tax=Watersipora subatra TaxID=2589382 RepID=UPI00355C4F66
MFNMNLRIFSKVATWTFSSIRSASSLPAPKHITSKPQVEYRDLCGIAMNLYTSGIEAISSQTMVEDALKFNAENQLLEIRSSSYHINKNVHIIAVGKAVIGMCRSVEDILGDHIVRGLAFVPENSVKDLEAAGKKHLFPSSRFELVLGSHAAGSEQSLESARRVLEITQSLQANDILITLISGGGSALLTMPKPSLTLEDKIKCIELMKSHKVPYLDQNTVRKNLSMLKGGGLSASASPAKVISLILSNLPHNSYTEVAGGLTTSDSSTPQQAMEVLRKYKLVEQMPSAVVNFLEKECHESTTNNWCLNGPAFTDTWEERPKSRYDTSNTINILAGSDEIAIATILNQCAKYEIPAHAIEPSRISTSTLESGKLFACLALYAAALVTRNYNEEQDRRLIKIELDCIRLGMPKTELKSIAIIANEARSTKKPICLIFTSEIVIDVKEGSPGRGGRCQEVALATAINLQKKYSEHESLRRCDVQLLSVDSDGIDGGNEVAGAIANCTQADQIVCGKTAQQYLDEHDSYTFYKNLESGKYHVSTGATGIDVQNFQLLLIRNNSW